jgi:hypothetical protein
MVRDGYTEAKAPRVPEPKRKPQPSSTSLLYGENGPEAYYDMDKFLWLMQARQVGIL